jgi:hypothetical protein
MLLRITNGTTTVILHSDAGTPATGLVGARYIPTEGNGETVAESIDVVFSGTPANILSAFNSIKRLLREAEEIPVYLEYALVNVGTVYRSPIISGEIIWSPNRTLRQFWDTTTIGEAAIVVTRSDYWEGPETNLADNIAIVNGTSSPYNAVGITDPGGNLPTPIRVFLASNNVSDIVTPMIYLNVDSFAAMTTNQHLITSGAGAVTWGANLTYTTPLWNITPSATVTAKLAGKDVNVLAAFTVLPSTLYLRAGLSSLFDSVYQKIQTGGEQYTGGHYLINLGTLQIPKTANSGLVVTISGYSVASGAATLSFIQLMPASGMTRLDVTHEWKYVENIHHGPDGTFYDTGISDQYSNIRPAGGPLMIWPGRTNRLTMLFDQNGSFTSSRQTNVTVFARQRRSTV